MSSKSSGVWKYFQKPTNVSVSLCLSCKKQCSRKGRGTTCLRNHLKSMHKVAFDEFVSEDRKKSEEKEKECTQFQRVKSDIMHKNVGEYFRRRTAWNDSNRKSKNLDRCVAENNVMDDLPFSHVEDIVFTRLMDEAVAQYRVKQRYFYSTLICNDIHDSVFNKIKGLINKMRVDNKISFTTDVWSDTSAGVLPLSLTAHTHTHH